MNSQTSPLVYLNLASAAGRTRLREDPLVASLDLMHQSDDPRLLIALGEISGSSRPITPRRMTRLAELLIIWLDDQEWLVVPHVRYGHDVEQALQQSFGNSLSLELIPDGSFHAELSGQASILLAESESITLNGPGRLYIDKTELQSLCIRPWTSRIAYDLLLTRADKTVLETWLTPLQ